jgi:hypothetical protein
MGGFAVTFTIPIRHLLALRGQVSDQVLLDYLTITTIARDPGRVRTLELQHRWGCSQPQVSRRVSAIARAGLADITAGQGAYQVHELQRLPVAFTSESEK